VVDFLQERSLRLPSGAIAFRHRNKPADVDINEIVLRPTVSGFLDHRLGNLDAWVQGFRLCRVLD